MIKKRQLLLFFLFLAFLPVVLFLVKIGARLWPRAAPIPANIVVDAQGILGPMPASWRALAQGGEDKGQAGIGPVIEKVAKLKPTYIRIDHIYDAYSVVSRDKNELVVYDWSQLDQVVDEILAIGALPFFSLSYMPPVLARDGNPVNEPNSWNEWENLIQATVEHYSGQNNRNLSGVYYEVWNEPDLFGKWHLGCSAWRIDCDPAKNYLNLYYHTLTGVSRARNINLFKIGGPATTGLYPNWISLLLDFCSEKNLKIDFLSWHRYSKDPSVFEDDVEAVDFLIEKYPQFATLEKIISEWGSDSENSPFHDGVYDAAHTIAVVRRLLARIDWGFGFEIKDGRSLEGKPLWGRWGILTHEDFGAQPKPRYYAFDWLNKLEGNRLSVTGEGSYVSAIAGKTGREISVLLVNFDPSERNSENVPLTINNLEPGRRYRLEVTRFLEENSQMEEISASSVGSIGRMFILSPSSILLLTLSPL